MPLAALPETALAVTISVVNDAGEEIDLSEDDDADAPPLAQFYAHAVPRIGETLYFYNPHSPVMLDAWDVTGVYWMIPVGEIVQSDGSADRPTVVCSPVVQVRRREG